MTILMGVTQVCAHRVVFLTSFECDVMLHACRKRTQWQGMFHLGKKCVWMWMPLYQVLSGPLGRGRVVTAADATISESGRLRRKLRHIEARRQGWSDNVRLRERERERARERERGRERERERERESD